MALYAYVKAPPGYTLKKPRPFSSYLKVGAALVLMVAGIASLTTVAYPLISYQLTMAPRFERSSLSPLSAPAGVQPAHAATPPQVLPEMVNTSLDYTNAEVWFPTSSPGTAPERDITYLVSIPKLRIKDAVVKEGESDLKKTLIQYRGTAEPGKLGNPVVFGHSVLPQFFNPKNYTTIFSTLYTLKKGDEIVVAYDGITYKYVVREMYEVTPSDLSPLAQSYDDHHLTLITCSPPGTYLRRLVVKAVLR